MYCLSDPDDPREEKRVGAYTFLLDGSAEDVEGEEFDSSPGAMDMYNDDPDDAVLEGEEPLGSKAAARPAFLRAGVDTGSSTEDESGDDGSADGSVKIASNRSGRGASGSLDRGRGGSRGSDSRGGGARGRGRGGAGVGRGGGELGGGGRGRGGRGGSGRGGGGRGRGARGRGGRGAHGRRDGAAKKQARAGM